MAIGIPLAIGDRISAVAGRRKIIGFVTGIVDRDTVAVSGVEHRPENRLPNTASIAGVSRQADIRLPGIVKASRAGVTIYDFSRSKLGGVDD